MQNSWLMATAGRIRSTHVCPRCDAVLVRPASCVRCGAEFAGPEGQQVLAAAREAADSLDRLRELIETLPTVARVPGIPSVVSGPAAMPVAADDASPRSSATLQSVLAVIGAGLIAVASVVFTSFNPDVRDPVERSIILGCVAVVFVIVCVALSRRSLRFSAEAVAALAAVLSALDVAVISHVSTSGQQMWLRESVLTAILATVLLVIGGLTRTRTWILAGSLGAVAVPIFLGAGVGGRFAGLYGLVVAAAVSCGMLVATRSWTRRLASPMRLDRVALAVGQALIIVAAYIVQTTFAPVAAAPLREWWLVVGVASTLLGLIAAASGAIVARRLFSATAGVLIVGGFATAANAVPYPLGAGAWTVAAADVAVVAVLVARSRVVARLPLLGGAMAALLLVGAFPAARLFAFDLNAVISFSWADFGGIALTIGGLVLVWLRERREQTVLSRVALAIGLWTVVIGVLLADGNVAIPLTGLAVGSLAVTAVASLMLWRVPLAAGARASLKAAPITGTYLVLISVAAQIAVDHVLTAWVGILLLVTLAVASRAVPPFWRILHVIAGYAYGLFLVSVIAQLLGLTGVPVLAVTTVVGAVFALVITIVRRVDARYWVAVLAVTAVPFLLGVAAVISTRDSWTALSTGSIVVLAITLVLNRRPGAGAFLRAAASAIVVPGLAVVVICVGAQVLRVSASPVTLPIIAVVVGVALAGASSIPALLARRGVSGAEGQAVRLFVEATSYLTAVIAVGLAFVRLAAGPNTALVVLLLLGLGSVAHAVLGRRRVGGAAAGAWWTFALWTLLGMNGVGVVELYVLPPALGACVVAVVGVIRARHPRPALVMLWFAMAVCVLPSLLLVTLNGWGVGQSMLLRPTLLVVSAAFLIAVDLFLARGVPDSATLLRRPILTWAIVASLVGSVESVRVATGFDSVGSSVTSAVLPVVIAGAALTGVLGGLAGQRLASMPGTGVRAKRWLLVPAAVGVTVALISVSRADALVVGVLEGASIAFIVLAVVTAFRAPERVTVIPPVWVLFVLAWATAVAAWAPRLLRLEAFSLPFGIGVILAGAAVVIRNARNAPDGAPADASARLDSWPHLFVGSWRLLGPGVFLTLLPSVVATGTDPVTWRAVLVLVMALLAILVGLRQQFAAPFVLGIAALPIENVVVFFSQLGHEIQSTPWWISLASVGAVLMIIAVAAERRTTGGGFAARLRDLS